MDASLVPTLAPYLIIGISFGALAVVAWVLRRHVQPWVAIMMGPAHFVAYVAAFSAAFGIGDSGASPPTSLSALIAVLGFPVMLLFELVVKISAGKWWGNDYVLLGLVALNAILWGLAIGAAARMFGRGRAAA